LSSLQAIIIFFSGGGNKYDKITQYFMCTHSGKATQPSRKMGGGKAVNTKNHRPITVVGTEQGSSSQSVEVCGILSFYVFFPILPPTPALKGLFLVLTTIYFMHGESFSQTASPISLMGVGVVNNL